MMVPRANQRDRWLLSYADFVTLLFAVFVMMYAMEKSRSIRRSVPVSPPVMASVPAPPIPSPSIALAPSTPNTLLNDLQANLIGEQEKGFLTLSAEPRGVVITLNDEALFNPGEARVQPSAEPGFEKIGNVLARYPNRMLLEGHTDSVPIHNDRFQSNWELSTARSIAVMKVLEQSAHIAADRFSIGGSADNAPVTPDVSKQGRARNRRVDIVVLEDSRGQLPGFAIKKSEPAPRSTNTP